MYELNEGCGYKNIISIGAFDILDLAFEKAEKNKELFMRRLVYAEKESLC